MTPIPQAPPYAALATGLNELVDEARYLGGLAGQLGERTTLTASLALEAESTAEVDRIAAGKGVRAAWTGPCTYAATWAAKTVTVTVSYFTNYPCTDPIDADTMAAIYRQGAARFPGQAA